MATDNKNNYDICVRSKDKDSSSDTKIQFSRRGILALEIDECDRVSFYICNKDGTIGASIAIPNADFIFMIEQYVGAIKSIDEETISGEINISNGDANMKSLSRLKAIMKRI